MKFKIGDTISFIGSSANYRNLFILTKDVEIVKWYNNIDHAPIRYETIIILSNGIRPDEKRMKKYAVSCRNLLIERNAGF